MTSSIGRPFILGVVVAFLGACGPAASTNPAASTPVVAATGAPAPSASEATPLVIGVIVPFTESAVDSDMGVAQQRAAQLYVRQHADRLAGRAVKLAFEDESITGALDTVKATQLVETEHASVLLGLIGNEGAYAVRAFADARHVVYIDTNASGNALTRTNPGCSPSCASPYVFRTSYSAWQLSEPLGAWAARKGIRQFDVLAADDTFGAESAAAFVEGLGTSGGTATAQRSVKPGADMSAVVAAIVGQATKDVFAAFAGGDAAAFVTAWDHAGLTAKGYRLYGPGPLADTDVLAQVKGAAVEITTASFWSSTLDNAESRALLDSFAAAYKDENGGAVATDSRVVAMWDAMSALDQALQKTSANPAGDQLVPALAGVAFRSPRGPFAFDHETHNVVDDIYVCQVHASGSAFVSDILDTIPGVTDPGK